MQKLERLTFFLCLLFLPTQLGKHFWPDFSFIFSLKIDYLSPTLYFWDILVFLLLVVWALRRPVVNKFALGLVLFFLLSQIVSIFSALNIGASFIKLEQLVILAGFFVYLASQEFKLIRKPVCLALSVTIIYEGLIALGEFILGHSLGLWILGERTFALSTPSIATFNFNGQVFLRPYATFSHPNVLGAYMAVVVPLLAVLRSKKGFYGFGVSLVGVIAGILTFSRGAILVIMAEVVYSLRKRRQLLTVLLIVLFPLLVVRFNSAFNFDSLSIIRREDLLGIAFRQFVGSPLFGIGLNNFINYTATSELVAGPNRFLQPVHNIYLLLLSETGVVGFVGFFTLVWFYFKGFLRRTDNLSRTFLGMMLVILFLGMFDHYFLTLPQGQRLLFLILGLGYSVKRV